MLGLRLETGGGPEPTRFDCQTAFSPGGCHEPRATVFSLPLHCRHADHDRGAGRVRSHGHGPQVGRPHPSVHGATHGHHPPGPRGRPADLAGCGGRDPAGDVERVHIRVRGPCDLRRPGVAAGERHPDAGAGDRAGPEGRPRAQAPQTRGQRAQVHWLQRHQPDRCLRHADRAGGRPSRPGRREAAGLDPDRGGWATPGPGARQGSRRAGRSARRPPAARKDPGASSRATACADRGHGRGTQAGRGGRTSARTGDRQGGRAETGGRNGRTGRTAARARPAGGRPRPALGGRRRRLRIRRLADPQPALCGARRPGLSRLARCADRRPLRPVQSEAAPEPQRHQRKNQGCALQLVEAGHRRGRGRDLLRGARVAGVPGVGAEPVPAPLPTPATTTSP